MGDGRWAMGDGRWAMGDDKLTARFDNYMTGPQVIEVVVIDSDIDETNESKGEPDVTINGAKLRMAQATDGNWYGYFAEKDQAIIADATAAENAAAGYGLDFGQFCGSDSTTLAKDGSTQLFSDTDGVAIPVRSNGTSFGKNGTDFDNSSDGCTTPFAGKFYTTLSGDITGTHSSAYSANATYSHLSTTASQAVENRVMNVVRESKAINTAGSANPDSGAGQIGLLSKALWPFIQLYDLDAGSENVTVQYNKGGGAQTVTLSFDTADDYITTTLDRTKYPTGAEVHVEIADVWLNIDPTDEDSWTFDTDGTYGVYYGIYDENGTAKATGSNRINLMSAEQNNDGVSANRLTSLMNSDGVLKITPTATGSTATLTFDNNGNGATTGAGGTADVTMTELGPASGVFASYDELDDSMININSSGVRNTSGTIDYNDSAQSVVIGLNFGSIDIQPTDDTWNSGEEVSVVLKDNDVNKNSRVDEDIDVSSNTFLIVPTITTGDPFTLNEATGDNSTKAVWINTFTVNAAGDFTAIDDINPGAAFTVDSFSDIGRLAGPSAADLVKGVLVDFQVDFDEFRQTVQDTTSTSGLKGFNLVNIDVSGINDTDTFDVYLVNATGDILKGSAYTNWALDTNSDAGTQAIPMLQDVEAKSISVINGTVSTNGNAFGFQRIIDSIADQTGTKNVGVMIIQNSTTDVQDNGETIPFVIDFFSFGFTDDGYDSSDRVANQIIRLELEETGDNTGEFVGTIEYVMVNQVNILSQSTYTGLSPISDEVSLVAIEDLTDEDSIRVNYLDVGADGVATQIADQQAAPTHSGVVSFDSENYKVADTVTITLEDQDLNSDSSLIDIYTVVADPNLAKTVEDSTLSKFTRTRAMFSSVIFVIGLLTMFSTYIIEPAIAIIGFSVMALSAYVFVYNTRALLKAENINEWNFKQVIKILRNKDTSRQK
jgi:hypothetical protein